MKLTYQTAVATMIQFIVLGLLNLINALDSIVTTCSKNSGDCLSNMIPSIILFILLSAWFAAVWVLGWAAQEQRNRRLGKLLIAVEALIALVALFNIKNPSGTIGVITSFVDLVLAIWVITLAWRLIRAGGGRVVSRQRSRRRRRPPTADQ